MKSTQRFLWLDPTTKEEKHYLLMPSEVGEFKNYVDLFPETKMLGAFVRLTGKNPMNVTNLRLEIIYYEGE